MSFSDGTLVGRKLSGFEGGFAPWRWSTSRPPSLCAPAVCSSRNPGRPRGPIWKGRVLSNEAMRAVQELKRAKSNSDADQISAVMETKVSRLIKPDMIAVLGELQRQNECDLALKMFERVRAECWYEAEEALFAELVITLSRNKLMEEVDKVYRLAREEEGPKSTRRRLFAEVIRAQIGGGNVERAMEVYSELKEAGLFPCEAAYGILRQGLEKNGKLELAAAVEEEYKNATEAAAAATY